MSTDYWPRMLYILCIEYITSLVLTRYLPILCLWYWPSDVTADFRHCQVGSRQFRSQYFSAAKSSIKRAQIFFSLYFPESPMHSSIPWCALFWKVEIRWTPSLKYKSEVPISVVWNDCLQSTSPITSQSGEDCYLHQLLLWEWECVRFSPNTCILYISLSRERIPPHHCSKFYFLNEILQGTSTRTKKAQK